MPAMTIINRICFFFLQIINMKRICSEVMKQYDDRGFFLHRIDTLIQKDEEVASTDTRFRVFC